MQQRRLRLGDILDDYCPRERRVTNHVVVAMIDDEVKQTRCATCDADHDYKQAKLPPQRRKRPESGAESVEAAAHRLRAMGGQPSVGAEADDVDSSGSAESLSEADVSADPPEADTIETGAPEPQPGEFAEPGAGSDDDGPVHRRLIRATLPRPEGQAPERKEPDFTMRHPGVRGREFGNGNDRGARRQARGPGGGEQPPRFGGPRQGAGGGSRSGSGQDQRPPGNRSGRPDDQRGNRSGSRGRSRKRGR